MKLDDIDKALLKELQKDCKQPIRDLSKKLKLSKTAIHHRIKKLEREKVISGYAALIDPAKIGHPSTAFMLFKIKQFPTKEKEFPLISLADNLAKVDRISEVYSLVGESDILIKVHGENEREIGEWQRNMLRGVKDMDTMLDRMNTILTYYTAKDTPRLEIK